MMAAASGAGAAEAATRSHSPRRAWSGSGGHRAAGAARRLRQWKRAAHGGATG